jgi:hypothetical protein
MPVTCAYTPVLYQKTSSNGNNKINIDDFTNGRERQDNTPDRLYYWDGTGILDVLINTLGKNVQMQYREGSIMKEQYSQAYIQMLQIASQTAIGFIQLQQDLYFKERQLDQVDAKHDVDTKLANSAKSLEACFTNFKLGLEEKATDSKIALEQRQIKGYDDNLVIKMLQVEVDAFALIYSSGMLDNPDLGPLSASNLVVAWHLLFNRIPDSMNTYIALKEQGMIS